MADERTYKMLLGAIAGGGSGGLPDYSEANDGDVLTVKEGTEDVTVVPEDTVTIVDAYVPLASVDISRLSDGSVVTVIVNGNSYNSIITGVDPSSLSMGWGIVVPVSADLTYFVEDQGGTGTAYFSAYDGNISIIPGEYTVSVVASVPDGELTPQWASRGIMVCNDSYGVLDKTWQEIYNAMNSSVLCVVVYREDDETSISIHLLQTVLVQEGTYSVYLDNTTQYSASTANEYPLIVE